MTRATTDCGMDSVCMEGSAREGARLSRRGLPRATVAPADEGVGHEGMGERIAVPGGRLVVDRDAGRVLLRIGEGMAEVAEGEQRPARAGGRHLRLEGIARGLRGDRIGSARHGENRRFYSAPLGRLRL